jgi:ribosomal protein S21
MSEASLRMVRVVRREHESTSALIRRFTRRVQRAGILLQARKVRFFNRKPNRNERRRSAKRREEIREERLKLYKLGKLEEEEHGNRPS